MTTGSEKLDWVVSERGKRDSCFAYERRGRSITGSGHIAKTFDRVHCRDRIVPDVTRYAPAALAFTPVVTAALDLDLQPLDGDARPLGDWLTTFPLVSVVLDPFTHESAWLLDTSKRILQHFSGADCRISWILTCPVDDAKRFLGPYAEEVLAFADPAGVVAKSLGVESAPAIALLRQDGEVTAAAEGWDPDSWREVAEAIAALTSWSRPSIPDAGDPVAYSGTPLS